MQFYREAIDPGYVAKILVDANKDNALSVGTPVAVFVEDANDISAFADFSIDMDSQSASSTLSAVCLIFYTHIHYHTHTT